MQQPQISRRHFVSRSCAAAIASSIIPNRWQAEALPQENLPARPTNARLNSLPHHLLVPVYREGKLIDSVDGDRDTQGGSYVIRINNNDGEIVPPHRHPEDEHVTVIQGTWYLGAGEKFDRGVLEEMTLGAYARVPKGMAHFAWSRGETIIQVHGIGPFRTDFIDPPIFLSAPNNQAHFKYKVGQRVLSQKGPGVIVGGGTISHKRRHERADIVVLFPPSLCLFADQMKTCSSDRVSPEQTGAVRLAGTSIRREAFGFRVPMILLKDHLKGLDQDRQCRILQRVSCSVVNIDVRHLHPS